MLKKLKQAKKQHTKNNKTTKQTKTKTERHIKNMGCCSSKPDGEREPLIQDNSSTSDSYNKPPTSVTFPSTSSTTTGLGVSVNSGGGGGASGFVPSTPTGGVILGDDGLILNSPAPTIVATSVLVGPGSSLPGDSFMSAAAAGGDLSEDSKGVDPADAAVQKVQQQLISITAEVVTVGRSEAEKRSREYGVVTVSKPLAAPAVEAIEGVPTAAGGSAGQEGFSSADLPGSMVCEEMDRLCEKVAGQVSLSAKEMGPLVVSLPKIPDFMK